MYKAKVNIGIQILNMEIIFDVFLQFLRIKEIEIRNWAQ
jgi:hypothetical protein